VGEDTGWDEVVRIDGMVELMLEMFAVPYVPMACLSLQERVRLVERVLALAGLEPRGREAPLAHEAHAARERNGHASGNGSRRAGAPR
jgi:hypothetical protein